MSGCSARKATREVVDLDVERGAMDDKDLDVGSQIHIPTKKEIVLYNGIQTSSKNAYGTIAIHAMRRLTKATPCAHAEIHNTPAYGADLIFFFFLIIQKYRPR